MRIYRAFLFVPLLLTGSGCCGSFEPSEAGTRRWVNAEIRLGADENAAMSALARHGFQVKADIGSPALRSEKHVGLCYDYIQITVFFDPEGNVVRTEVTKRSEGL